MNKNNKARPLPKSKTIFIFDAKDPHLLEEFGGEVHMLDIELLDTDGFFVKKYGLDLKKACGRDTPYLPVFKIVLRGQTSEL